MVGFLGLRVRFTRGRWLGELQRSLLVFLLVPLFSERSLLINIAVSCSCAHDQWYSLGSNADMFCMPSTSCPPGMTTSVSTNSYCATAPASDCKGVATTTNHCQCAEPAATPVYENRVGGMAIGCK